MLTGKLIHGANALVCLSAMLTAGGVITAAGSGLSGLLSWNAMQSDAIAPDLARDLAHAMGKHLSRDDISDDQRALIPQMIEIASRPDPDDVIDAGLDPERLIAVMQTALTDPEHRRPENLALFREIVRPALRRVLDDPEFIEKLAPALMRTVLGRLQGLDEATRATLIAALDARAGIGRIEESFDRMHGQFAALMDDLGRSNRDQMEALASRFRIADAWTLSDAELRRELEKKAEDWRALRSRFAAIPDAWKALSGIREAAQAAIEGGRLDEADALLTRAHAIELEQAAQTAERRADQALLRGRVEQAFALLTAAADSLSVIDPLEPARRRIHQYFKRLREHGHRYGGTGIAHALEMLSPVVTDDLRREDAALWATGKHACGIALYDSGTRQGGPSGAALLGQAVQAYRDAMAVHTRSAHPVAWARAQNNLGSALRAQGARIGGPEGIALLEQAVDAYRDALQIRSASEHPTDWAATQNNLGNALVGLSECLDEDARAARAERLGEAVEAFDQALQVYTRADHPLQWSMAQNNLAVALLLQGRLTEGAIGAVFLGRAAKAFRTVLAMRDRERHPLRWASSQNNLGNALAEQGERVGGAEGAGLLMQAVEAFEAALEVRSRAEHPVDWAETQKNLAQVDYARAGLGEPVDRDCLRAALVRIEAALEVYDARHMPHDHQKARALRDDIRAALDGAG